MSEVDDSEAARPRKRQLDDDTIQTLLNSVTLEQIREAVFRLSPRRSIPVRTHADAYEALVHTQAGDAGIRTALLDVERTHPFKHCLLLRFKNAPEAANLVQKAYHRGNYSFTLSYVSTTPVLSLTFEHLVEVKEWVEVEPTVRKLQSVQTRQPIVVRFNSATSLVTLSYPGFTNNQSTKGNGSTYEPVISALLHILKYELNASLSVLPIKDSLRNFLDGENRRVIRVRADVDHSHIRVDLSSKAQSNHIEQGLASFIGDYLPKGFDLSVISEAAKKAFNNATVNSIVLFWLQESIFTRLRFWDAGTELLFIWNKETPNYRIVDAIAQVLSDASLEILVNGVTGTPVAWIASQPPLAIITPGDLAMRAQLPPGSAGKILVKALNAGLVEPVYRVNRELCPMPYEPDWNPILAEVQQEVYEYRLSAADEPTINDIEVAFRRIAMGTSRNVQ